MLLTAFMAKIEIGTMPRIAPNATLRIEGVHHFKQCNCARALRTQAVTLSWS